MSRGIQAKIKAEARFKADVVGAVSGLCCFLILAIFASSQISQWRANQLAFLNLLCSALAGLLAAISLPFSEIDDEEAPRFATRAGVRSGFISAAVASGALLLLSVWRALQASSPDSELGLRLLTGHSLLIFAVSILSCGAAGLAGGAAGLCFRKPEFAKAAVAVLFQSNWQPLVKGPDQASPDRKYWIAPVILTLAILAWLSPVVLLFIPLKSAPSTGAPAQNQIAAFYYSKPVGFDKAEATQISVFAVKPIPPALINAPMLMTPHGLLFAYCPVDAAKEGTIAVINLDTLEKTASFRLQSTPTNLAWAPDFHKLLYTTADGRLGIANTGTGQVTELPRPKGQDLPNSRPIWWDEQEVAFFPSDESDFLLSLDTLRLSPLNESPKYKSQRPYDLKRWKRPSVLELPRVGSSQMVITLLLRSVHPPPRRQPSGEWGFQVAFALAFRDGTRPITRILPSLILFPGEQLIPAPDGSKIIHLSNSSTEVIYFTLRDNPIPLISVASPFYSPQVVTEAESLVSDHRLCAFAYAPMKNPLNGKTIGPDRQHVRALFRVKTILQDTLELWETEAYETFQPGDVIADLHTHKAGEADIAKNIANASWWSAITPQSSPQSDGIPRRSDVSIVDTEWIAGLTQGPYCLTFTGMSRPSRQFSASLPEQPKESPPATTPGPAPAPLVAPPRPSAPAIPTDDIERFLTNHHRMASANNVDGLVLDYDDFPTVMGYRTPRITIRDRELEYHRKWNRVVETVLRPIVITPEADRFNVSYTVDFRTESSAEGRWVAGKSAITLTLRPVNGGFSISEQTATIHDRTEGRLANGASNGPQPIPASIQNTNWVATFTSPATPNISVSDVMRLTGSKATILRTFRLINENGIIIRFARAEFAAIAEVSGSTLTLNFKSFTWTPNFGNAEFMNSMNGFATNQVGSVGKFTITNDTLVQPTSGLVLRKEK